MDNVNERIVKCRKLANLTQTDMAEKLNIKCSTYSQMERKGIITAERLFEMANIFGVTPCHLYNGEEPCKKEASYNFAPNENNALQFKEPEPVIPQKEMFVVTKKEENIIKLIRSLSKPNYAKTIKFIEDIYKEEKK